MSGKCRPSLRPKTLENVKYSNLSKTDKECIAAVFERFENMVEVVRCKDCVHAVPLDRNCELSASLYMHCGLWRGDETKNVWHKYKRYYKDYSLVFRDDFCSAGERIKKDE